MEQRTWLNGLFAGLFGLPENVTPVSTADAAKLLAGLLDGAVGAAVPQNDAAEVDDGAPWHDPAMPMPDRMKLADGKPLPRRLMAAMAQQDCGQCGYNCKDYADALFAKSEKRLNLCVPGGKETSRMLKQLYQELDGAALLPEPAQPKAAEAQAQSAHAAAPGRSRDNPVYATFLSRRRLNKPGSEKEAWHVDVDLAGTDLDYVVGDSFGVFPANDHDLVTSVLSALDVPEDFPIGDRAFREALTDGVSLSPAPDMLFELISYLTGGERRQKAKRLRPVKIRMATPQRSTFWQPCTNSPASGRTPRLSSRRSILCSPAPIRSPRRIVAIRDACRSWSMRSATRSTNACGSASARPFSAAASRPATR